MRVISYSSADAAPSRRWIAFIEGTAADYLVYFAAATEEAARARAEKFWAEETAKANRAPKPPIRRAQPAPSVAPDLDWMS